MNIDAQQQSERETKHYRDLYDLSKSKNKLSNDFSAHCVDSWVLANSQVGGHALPDNTEILFLILLRFHRRQLHFFTPSRGGRRSPYGGTRSLGFKRENLIKHKKYGLGYVASTPNPGRIRINDVVTKRFLSCHARVEDCKFLSFCSWRFL